MRVTHHDLKKAGYTLTELMVVLTIMGILATLVIPAFAGFLRRTRFQGSQNQLMSDIYYARSLAITQHKTIAMQFDAGQYRIVDTTDGSVERTTNAPRGVTFASTADPNFYSWGLADAVDITVSGASQASVLNLLPTGTVRHGS